MNIRYKAIKSQHAVQQLLPFGEVRWDFYYNPLSRLIQTDFPDDTTARVEFDVWQQKNYDQNDCDTQSPHYNTPQVVDMDVLGRPFQTKDDNGTDGTPAYYITHNKLDITGRILEVTDAKGRLMTLNKYALSEKHQVYVHNIDSATRWMLNDTVGNQRYGWDNRNHRIQTNYDALLRPTETLLQTGTTPEIITQKIIYGTNPVLNNIGEIIEIQAQDGKTNFAYNFKGNVTQQQKQFAADYQNELDWTTAAALLDETFIQETTYDALNRPVTITQPDSSIITYNYDKGGLLQQVLHGTTQHITDITYNARRQREDIYYGNATKTRYYYNPLNFRLTRILTTRNSGQDFLQDLNYTYDAVGNIVQQTDNAQQTFYFNNSVIAPTGTYSYDALYRLIQATGRELTSLTVPNQNDFLDNIPCPDTATNAMQNYTQVYQYDELGNILNAASQGNWTRDYVYNTNNNYLLKHDSQQTTDDYTYDAHGNMLSMPHINGIDWDYQDQLHRATNGTFTSYYNYDAQGNRTRKVVEKGNIIEIRYYIGNYELYQRQVNGSLDFERTTLNISDDEKVFVRIEQKTGENEVIRYQYDNHLGSACLELDDVGQIISYEEYHPFGTTSYRSGRTEIEVSLKRYKYCGKERDEETGLYYYGMRYYAAWICRFVSVDPLQFKYPHYTPYQYAGNKPITFIDLDGGEEADPKTGRITATIYFQFDVDTKQNTENTNTRALSDEQKQAYIDKFRENINTVWNSFTLADGTSVDVSGVEFLPAKEGMTASKLKSNEILLTVGYGENANPDAISGRSYIESDRKTGYMYHTENPTEAAHEFGHIMGLSDRYANVMQYAPNRSSEFNLLEANTIPLVLPKGESDYNPSTNLMSSHNGTSITQNQLSIVFAEGKTEENYQAPVVLIVNENSKLSPDAVSVKGNGVNYIVKGYKMEKGVLRSRTNSINWAAKNINRQNKSNVKNAYFQNRPNNWEEIRKRTRN